MAPEDGSEHGKDDGSSHPVPQAPPLAPALELEVSRGWVAALQRGGAALLFGGESQGACPAKLEKDHGELRGFWLSESFQPAPTSGLALLETTLFRRKL